MRWRVTLNYLNVFIFIVALLKHLFLSDVCKIISDIKIESDILAPLLMKMKTCEVNIAY